MSSAAQAVLSTAELLEAILVGVDIRTLLVSVPRVSRRWHAVVASSLPLQRALFFHPESEDDSAGDRDRIPAKRQNPLLRVLFPAWFECVPSFRPSVAEPLHRFPATVTMGYKRFQELPLYDASLHMKSPGGHDNPFLRPEASWRRMLTSQPPCRIVVASASRAPGASLSKTLGQPRLLRYPEGLRMGTLYDMTLRHCSTQTRGGFGSGGSGFMVVWVEGGGRRGLHRPGAAPAAHGGRAARRLRDRVPAGVGQAAGPGGADASHDEGRLGARGGCRPVLGEMRRGGLWRRRRRWQGSGSE
ncbi:hypothetical protein ACCO45_007081 [Purpureocillium lilacinum]|uniref:Uncharacterized protein n=1 Tax=Purpureocillium lilacinum TaxID=33203 RepID=A0ACC4DTN5_PURLI